ncbi:MAG: hypothetical protein JWN86_2984 [Planctomycetota bacterium]|nr:hypothetical protein [Planctomycetota bacterium]
MRFVADECCAPAMVDGLRLDGHDVYSIRESSRGIPDPDVLGLAFREDRLLITEDSDHGKLVVLRCLPTHGILYLRMHAATGTERLQRIREVLTAYPTEHFHDTLVVIDADKVRFRKI